MSQAFLDEPAVEPTLEVPLPSSRGRQRPCDLVGWPVPSCSDGPFTYAETLLLVDWDDTISPTTWIISEGLVVDNDKPFTAFQEAQLAQVQQSAAKVLRTALTLGKVIMVTNAEQGWIEMSCQNWLPGLVPLVASILCISARTAHETFDCQSPSEWKLRSFEHQLALAFPLSSTRAVRRNILSFGDSCHEREALLRSTLALRDCRCKTVKFEDRPSPETLNRQQLLLGACLRQIVEHNGNLDLRLQKQAPAEPTLEQLATAVDEAVDRIVTRQQFDV